MTGDLYAISTLENKKKVNTEEFLKAIDERLAKISLILKLKEHSE